MILQDEAIKREFGILDPSEFPLFQIEEKVPKFG
jgi:hypothetical protein